jgi:2-oxoglutarate ferredoxin oxidoreductase subunit gamma
MNIASLNKFESRVRPGGIVFVNSSLIDRKVGRDDVTEIRVPANEIAEGLGNAKAANMVMLGGIAKKTGVVNLESLSSCLEKVLSKRAMPLLDLNKQALKKGFEEVA